MFNKSVSCAVLFSFLLSNAGYCDGMTDASALSPQSLFMKETTAAETPSTPADSEETPMISKRVRVTSAGEGRVYVKDSKGVEEYFDIHLVSPRIDLEGLRSGLNDLLGSDPARKQQASAFLDALSDLPPEEIPRLVTYDKYIEDLFAFVVPENTYIAVHAAFLDDPLVLLHELAEYSVKTGSVRMILAGGAASLWLNRLCHKMNVYAKYPDARWFGGEVAAEVKTKEGFREIGRVVVDGPTLSIAQKNAANQHYLLRAWTREVFGAHDVFLSTKIKRMQDKDVQRSMSDALSKKVRAFPILTPRKIPVNGASAVSAGGAEVDRLFRVLHSQRDMDSKLDTLRELRAFLDADPRVLGYFKDTLKRGNTDMRMAILMAISDYESPVMIDAVAPLLQDTNRYVCSFAGHYLVQTKDARVRPLLIGALRHRNADVRKIAIIGLKERALADPSLIEVFRSELTGNTEPLVRRTCAEALWMLKDRNSFDVLFRALDDPDDDVAAWAMGALNRMRTPEDVAAFMDVFRRGSAQTRRRVIVGLASMAFEGIARGEILPAVTEYFIEEGILTRPLFFADPAVTMRLTALLLYRREEIAAGAIAPDDIITIYGQDVFLKRTGNMTPANQFSIARGIENTLKRFGLPCTGKTVKVVLPYIFDAWNEHARRTVLGGKTHVIIICNSEKAEEALKTKEDIVRRFDIPDVEVRVFVGKEDKSAALHAVATAPPHTTVWLVGHGESRHFLLEGDTMAGGETEKSGVEDTISFLELAVALLTRALHNDGNLSDMTICNDACYGADFMNAAYNVCAMHIESGTIQDLPLGATLTNRGALAGYRHDRGGLITAAVKNLPEGASELRMKNVYDMEDLHADIQDNAYFLPISEEKHAVLLKELGVSLDAEGAGVMRARFLALGGSLLDVNLRLLDAFEALVQKGETTEEGVPVQIAGASGDRRALLFASSDPAEKISADLRAAMDQRGLKPPAGLDKIVYALQRYFQSIGAVGPGMVEVREKVLHYLLFSKDRTIVDIVLFSLDAKPQELLPFYTFLLSHECSHKFAGEPQARRLDLQRFIAFSPRHRAAVVRLLEMLGAEKAYLDGLKALVGEPARRAVFTIPAIPAAQRFRGEIDAEQTGVSLCDTAA